jgi:DNA-3-methyladenine glycosylase II
VTQTRLEAHFARVDPVLWRIVAAAGRCALPKRRRVSVFESLSRSIASQQLSGVVARRIQERLESQYGGRFPTAAQISTADAEALRAAGFSYAKIAALKDLAAHTLDGRLPSDAQLATLDDQAVIDCCIGVHGIGRWTAEMLLMFTLGRPDVLPVDDFGVRNGFRLAYGLKGLPQPRALAAFGTRWSPHRSAAAWYLWRAVDLHREDRLPTRQGRAPRVAIAAPRSTPTRSRVRPTAKKGRPA